MSHVITGSCFNCKYTDCVTVCPVDCFREGEKMLYILPDDMEDAHGSGCIDCTACVSICPVEAIYAEGDVPEDQKDFIALNREMSAQSLPITEQKPPLC